jgi:hypothetical protein
MHRHEHPAPNWNVWRSLIFLWTAAIALVLNGATSIGLFAAIVGGFVAAAAAVSCVFFVVHGHDSTGRSNQ